MTNPSGRLLNTHRTNAFREWILATVICSVVSAAVILPFFRIGERLGAACCGGEMPVTHDMVMHLNQMQSFYEGLSSGRFYPRWNAQTNRGFGAPTTIFYPPLVYYLTAVLFSLTRDWTTVIVLLYVLTMLVSGLAFYVLARVLYRRGPALLATVLYMVMPYHLLNHYQRGALAECLTFTFIPLMALLLMRLFRTDSAARSSFATMAWLGVVWGAFVLGHPPTAYQFMLIVLPIHITIGIVLKRWKGLLLTAGGLVMGLLISASYLIPAIAEQRHVHAEDVEHSWPYHESYVLNWSSNRYDHVGDDFIVRIDRLWIYTTLLVLITSVGITLTRWRRGRANERAQSNFTPWLLAALMATFMMLPISRGIGLLIPKIEIGVFAWRMLALSSAGLAVLLGYLASLTGESERWRTVLFRIASGVIVAAIVIIDLVYVVRPMYRAEAFQPNPDHSNYSLVPAAGLREQPNRPEVTIDAGRGTSQIRAWDPERRVIDVEMTESGTASFRLFNYPGWKVRDGDVPLPVRTGSVGEVVVDLAAGRHVLKIEFQNTPLRSIATFLSILGSVLAVGVIAIGSHKRPSHSNRKLEA